MLRHFIGQAKANCPQTDLLHYKPVFHLYKKLFFFSYLRDCHKWRPERTANCERRMLGLICCLSGGFNGTEERISVVRREWVCVFSMFYQCSPLISPHPWLHHISLSLYFWVDLIHWFTCPTPAASGPLHLRSATCGWSWSPFPWCRKDAL